MGSYDVFMFIKNLYSKLLKYRSFIQIKGQRAWSLVKE